MINLHNHSTWSDGAHAPEHLAKMGVLGGLTHIGISDHFFTDKLLFPHTYVDADQIDDYVADVRHVDALMAERISVLAGIEVDWSSRASLKFPDLWEQINRLDYVLFEYVGDSDWTGGSLETLLSVRHFIRIPVGLAHNDLSQNFAPLYTSEELVALLQEHEIFVELSTDPRTMYYRNTDPYNVHLWQVLAESSVRFSIGSDTHGAIDNVARVEDAHGFLEKRGLLGNLITAWWDPSRQVWSEQKSP